MAWVAWRTPKERVFRVLDAGLLVLLGALLGARAAFILTHPGFYQTHWLATILLWQGGLSWPGALAGFGLSLALAAGLARSSLGELADSLLPLLPPLLVGIWLGCWLTGVAYGPAAPQAWWGMPAPDEWGTWAMRFPLQIGSALLTLVIFWLIDRLRPWLKRPGQAASLAYLGTSALTLAVACLRIDPVPMAFGWRWDILAGIFFSVVFLLFTLVVFWPRKGISSQPQATHKA